MLKGYKTYLVAAAGVIVNGLYAMGYIPDGVVPVVNVILAYLGLAALRAGVKNG